MADDVFSQVHAIVYIVFFYLIYVALLQHSFIIRTGYVTGRQKIYCLGWHVKYICESSLKAFICYCWQGNKKKDVIKRQNTWHTSLYVPRWSQEEKLYMTRIEKDYISISR